MVQKAATKDQNRLKQITGLFDSEKFKALNEEMSFADYVDLVYQKPATIRTAFQKLYDMIMASGSEEFERYRKTLVHYRFFDDPKIPIFGLEKTLDELVKFIRGAAGGYGTEKRVLLLHGPVGSSKSTICRLLKRGLERYSATDDGAWYTYKWVNLPTEGEHYLYTTSTELSSMNEEPLKLLPQDLRNQELLKINEVWAEMHPEVDRSTLYSLRVDGEPNPRCKFFLQGLLQQYNGDLLKVLENHVRVVRRVYSESDRVGIATFQPKDEKNQDATELTGDINYRQIGIFGSDSDPRAFNFDGEFCVGNRGMIEFIEMLKLQQEFLYDLLEATQDHSIKPKKSAKVSIDEIIIGHTNNPEFEKLKANPHMEALRDRTVKIDVPYLTDWKHEIQVLMQDYGPGKVKQHVAPHTIEMVALWSVCTRLVDDQDSEVKDLVEKAKLYDGQYIPNWTEDKVRELREKYPKEGMDEGMSARFAQDKLSNCFSDKHDYINLFMAMNEIKDGLTQSSLIDNEEHRAKYESCIDLVIKEYGEVVKTEVQNALVANDKAVIQLCANYIDNVMAYIKQSKIKNKFTGRDQEPDEKLMRSIEEKIGVAATKANDYRRSLAAYIGDMAIRNEKFKWDSNEELKKALEMKLFEDVKDTVKLSALSDGAAVVDPENQEKIDKLKDRLIRYHGYNEQSARDILDYVGGIFARGDIGQEA